MNEEVKKLERSIIDKKLLGVCSGLAKYTESDPTLWRLAFILLIFIYPPIFLAYFLFALVMPSDAKSRKNLKAEIKQEILDEMNSKSEKEDA